MTNPNNSGHPTHQEHTQLNNSQKQWVLASNNKGKLAELQALFTHHQLDVQLIPQAQLTIADAVEDGLSFVENAIIKARHASRISGLPAIADDSGLCVPALGGAPGIYSARYAGEHGNDALNNQKLLADLAGLRQGQPHPVDAVVKGLFVCILVMVRHADDPLPLIAEGIWQGEILTEPKGDHGFGYDPLFWLPELNKSSAELDKAEKNRISHRAIASQKLLTMIQSEAITSSF